MSKLLMRLTVGLGLAAVASSSFAVSFIDPSIASAVTQLETDATTLVGYLTALGMIIVGAFFVWRIWKRITTKV